MLKITIPATEMYDSEKNEICPVKEQTLSLEHSLLSISKWESKWHKAFFGKENKSLDETIDYIKCMTLTQNVDERVFYAIPQNVMNQISNYIQNPMTATWFSKENDRPSRETVTSELIYYWMIALNIPFDPCQKWHINRLLTLIRVCNIKNTPSKKMSKGEIMSRNRALNAKRKHSMHTKG